MNFDFEILRGDYFKVSTHRTRLFDFSLSNPQCNHYVPYSHSCDIRYTVAELEERGLVRTQSSSSSLR